MKEKRNGCLLPLFYSWGNWEVNPGFFYTPCSHFTVPASFLSTLPLSFWVWQHLGLWWRENCMGSPHFISWKTEALRHPLFLNFFWLRSAACRISVSGPRIEPRLWKWKHQILTARPPGNSSQRYSLENSGVRCKKDSWGILFTKHPNLWSGVGWLVSVFGEWKSWFDSSVRLELISFLPFCPWVFTRSGIFRITYMVPSPIISLLSVVPYLTGLTLPRKPETFRTWHLADQRCPQRQRLPQPGSGLGPGEADPSNLTFSDLIPPNQLFDLNCLQVKRGSKYQ